MTGLKLLLIFTATLFIDALVLPAFFGLRESFLSLLFLIIPIMYLGPTRKVLVYSVIFAFILELLRGLNLGNIAFPLLLAAVAIFGIQKLLDIRYTYDTRFSLSKSVIIALVSVIFIYAVNIEYFDYVISLIAVLEALVLVLVFNIIFNRKSDYVS